MRFRRWPRVTAYEDTGRKRAALERSQRLAREKLPLFADLIAATQSSADEEMARRANWWPLEQQANRDRRAQKWRQARARIAGFDDALRPVLVALWRTCPYPAEPGYLLDLLHMVSVGRIDPHRPPWKFHPTISPRISPNPSTFGAAFRQIGHTHIDAGPMKPPIEQLLFCGNLGSGLLFLYWRIRIDAGAALAAPTGNWIEIEIHGHCPDAEMALIDQLARAAQTWPVTVSRSRPAGALSASAGGLRAGGETAEGERGGDFS